MITLEKKLIARDTWLKAAEIFNLEILIPYDLKINRVNKEIFAYLADYGSPNGTILCLTSAPEWEIDEEIMNWAKDNGFFCSFLNIEFFLSFDKKYFIELLKDFRKY